MHKYITFFFSVTFLLSACKGNKAPNGIIDHNTMISLLTDVHITDGKLYSINQDPDSLYKYGNGMFLGVFKKYHTNAAQFKKSMQYYAAEASELNDIYQQVMIDLKKKNDSLNTVQLKINNALPKK
jgi:hypothetical protein